MDRHLAPILWGITLTLPGLAGGCSSHTDNLGYTNQGGGGGAIANAGAAPGTGGALGPGGSSPCPDVCGAACAAEPVPQLPPGCPMPRCACPAGSGGAAPGAGGAPEAGGTGGSAIEATGGRVDPIGTGGTPAGGVSAVTVWHSCMQPAPQATVAFVVDTSSSMGLVNAPSTRGQSKWALTRELLRTTWASLPSEWAVGVTFHNSEITRAVSIQPLGSDQLAALDAALDEVVPTGETSLFLGWQRGLEQLEGFDPPSTAYQSGGRSVVLFTDSVPTLNRDGTPGSGLNHSISLEEYEAGIQAVAEQYSLTKTATMVFGVPGSEDPQGAPYDPLYQLSELAVAGGNTQCSPGPTRGTVAQCYDAVNQRASTCLETRGSYCHQDLTTEVDPTAVLIGSLSTIVAIIPRCVFEVDSLLNGRSFDPDDVTITLTSKDGTQSLLARSLDAACTTGGWFFSSISSPVDAAAGERTRLELCPKSCDASVADEVCLDIVLASG
jgi:hypothetical protein